MNNPPENVRDKVIALVAKTLKERGLANFDEAMAGKIANIITTLLTTDITQQVSSKPKSAPRGVDE